jgi:hypothetical protein
MHVVQDSFMRAFRCSNRLHEGALRCGSIGPRWSKDSQEGGCRSLGHSRPRLGGAVSASVRFQHNRPGTIVFACVDALFYTVQDRQSCSFDICNTSFSLARVPVLTKTYVRVAEALMDMLLRLDICLRECVVIYVLDIRMPEQSVLPKHAGRGKCTKMQGYSTSTSQYCVLNNDAAEYVKYATRTATGLHERFNSYDGYPVHRTMPVTVEQVEILLRSKRCT